MTYKDEITKNAVAKRMRPAFCLAANFFNFHSIRRVHDNVDDASAPIRLLPGNVIYTTVEIVIGYSDIRQFRRVVDGSTPLGRTTE